MIQGSVVQEAFAKQHFLIESGNNIYHIGTENSERWENLRVGDYVTVYGNVRGNSKEREYNTENWFNLSSREQKRLYDLKFVDVQGDFEYR